MFDLTPKQKKIIAIARNKGYIRLEDVKIVYSDPKTGRAALERLAALEVLKETENFGHFVYAGKNDGEVDQMVLESFQRR